MPIVSIDNRRLYRQISDQICRLIDSGEYKPGERLPAERILAEQLNVSRPTVREALIALEVEGRVEIRGGAGVFVLDNKEIRSESTSTSSAAVPMPGPFEVLFARDLIEPDVAALAAKNATAGQIAELSQAMGDMVCCSASDPRRLEFDRNFHFAMAAASGNTALLLAIQALWAPREQVVYIRLEDHFHNEQVWQRSILEHREILEAVKRNDPKAARTAMHRHLKNARLRFASNWRQE
ncbi:FadR/GntR family transcriptional regulator [uncultured Propionivibrio sp.]|uniref:FadR/GntR family transcriptional regulator n=1 Tax=uncultured Propionivibrio sp. TaxID=426737 RepID=UPI0029C0EAA2|nr:FadR/GntR family transcriptional regulator [uncultured Propionivibrio sp.]